MFGNITKRNATKVGNIFEIYNCHQIKAASLASWWSVCSNISQLCQRAVHWWCYCTENRAPYSNHLKPKGRLKVENVSASLELCEVNTS